MPGFISRSACRGRRPSAHVAYAGIARPALSMRLLNDRAVARFIVAPTGYGKTSLALEYAETIFAWTHVFWINGASPCFIRDLDDASIARQCLTVDEKAALVVFEDVPALTAERAQRFSEEVDALLEHGCEVLVTCVPSCSMVAALQRDSIRLNARDLLLDNTELDECRTPAERARQAVESLGAAQRIPAIVWSRGDEGMAAFARQLLGEEMPLDLLMLIASTIVLQRATIADLQTLAHIEPVAIADFADDYPHLGFDQELESFEAAPIPMEALASPIKNKMGDLVARSLFESAEQLVSAWANVLIARGDAPRACDLVREVALRRYRGRWLVENAYDIVRQACFYPALRVVADRDANKGVVRMRVSAFEALARRVLGDEDGALQCAKRHAFDEAAPFDVRVLSLLVVARIGQSALYERALGELADLDLPPVGGEAGHLSLWRMLVEAWRESTRGLLALAQFWSGKRDEGADDDALCVVASWLFGLLDGDTDELLSSGSFIMHPAETYVRERLSAIGEGPLDYFAASAGLSMERAHMRGVRYEGGPLDAAVLVRLRQVEMSILAQRQERDAAVDAEDARRSNWIETHPDAVVYHDLPHSTARKRAVPLLTIRLFGHFEVAMGDDEIEQSRFRRSSTRTLLALLAVNQGRDLSRDSLASSLWPRSSEEIARKNFYAIWSQLRRALTLPDGTCPYLMRHQFGCGLEPRYVQSDAVRLNDICRELMFGVPNMEHWSTLFSEIDSHYGAELMPAERKNPLIVQARNEYRARLVDALVAATFSAIDIESPQWGIWFARSAVQHDDTREDAYAALMRAQIASNQRTAAMSTYLKCRHALADKLGIDPSPEITRLYESLLDFE